MNQPNINLFSDAESARLRTQEYMRRMYPNAVGIHENDMPNPFGPFVTMGNQVFVGDYDEWENTTRFSVAYYTPSFEGHVISVEYSKIIGFPVVAMNNTLNLQAMDWLHRQMREVSTETLPDAERTVRLVALSNAIRMISDDSMRVTEINREPAGEYVVVMRTNFHQLHDLEANLKEQNVSELYRVSYRF